MVIAEISADMLLIILLGMQVLVMVVGAVIAYLVKQGKLDAKTVEDAKGIAGALAGAIDTFKGTNPDASKTLLQNVVANVGDKKPVLDAFLKTMNLNKPTNGETKETG